MKIYHVKSARKDYPKDDIIKGQKYWYCEPKRKKAGVRIIRRKTKPEVESWVNQYRKRFMGEMSSNMEDWRQRFENLYYSDEKDELLAEVNDFLDEKKESLNNIPCQLQESHILNDQITELEEFIGEIEEWEEEEH